MAVPKKRTSKSKKNLRKENWKKQGFKETKKALSLLLSVLNKNKNKTKQNSI